MIRNLAHRPVCRLCDLTDGTGLAAFAEELYYWRSKAGCTHAALAEKAHYRTGFVGLVENCLRLPPLHLATVADELFGTGGVLARMQPFTRACLPRVPLRDVYELARTIDVYVSHALPELVRIPVYDQAVHDTLPAAIAEATHLGKTARTLAGRVQAQQVRLGLLFGEQALHAAYGGPDVLSAQLEYLVELAHCGAIIQLIPQDALAWVPPSPELTVVALRDGSEDIAFTQGIGANRPIVAEDAAAARHRIDMLRSIALPPAATVQRLIQAIDDLAQGTPDQGCGSSGPKVITAYSEFGSVTSAGLPKRVPHLRSR